MRACPNGAPYYLQHQVWKPDVDDPRGLGGDQINMALSSWNLLYGYLGDPAVRPTCGSWPILDGPRPRPGGAAVGQGFPIPITGTRHPGRYDGDMRAGPGFLQPDKAASFGAELIVLYKMTGERRYLDRRHCDRGCSGAKRKAGRRGPLAVALPCQLPDGSGPRRSETTATTSSTRPPTRPTGRGPCAFSTDLPRLAWAAPIFTGPRHGS